MNVGAGPIMRRGDWCQLAGGTPFWPLDPKPEEINIRAIAHSLSMQVRYNGAVHTFYSVAEHCVHIALWIKSQGYSNHDALWGLLHDAPEGLGLADLVRPVKKNVVGYSVLEDAVMAAVCERFSLSPDMPAIVKEADNRILRDEMAQAMDVPQLAWALPERHPLGITIEFWKPEIAKQMFLMVFAALGEAEAAEGRVA